MTGFSSIVNRYSYSVIVLRRLVITDFKLRYKGSVLGYLWTLLKPLALFAVMYLVFVEFLRFGENEPHFAVQLLLGTVLWNYFSEVTVNGVSSIASKGDMMRKLSFPRYVVVLAGSFSALINLTINLFVVGIFILINGVAITPNALLIIPIIIELFILGLGVAFILATVCVKLRDVNYIWEVILQVGFYATPIFYPIALVAEKSQAAAQLLLLSPVAQIIQDARYALISREVVTTWSYIANPFLVFIPIILVGLLIVIGSLYFRSQSPNFAEEI